MTSADPLSARREIRAGFLPPIAIFRDVTDAGRTIFEGDNQFRDPLSRILSEIDVYGGDAERREGFRRLWATASWETALPEASFGLSADTLEARSPAQDYFRIRTTADLPAEVERRQIIRVIRDVAADLLDAPFAASDLERLTVALLRLVETLEPLAAPDGSMDGGSGEWPAKLPPREMWIRRWFVAHQLHAMLNLFAASALAAASALIRAREADAAARQVDAARTFIEAFPAARAQALALPPSFYEDTLRPLMLPPLTSAPLSGKMHVEYATYRKALAAFVDLLPETCAELAATHPPLALSRDRLLEADLVDAERHVTSVEPHVRSARSLVQTSKSLENAVSVLRRIRHERAQRYAPFLRFPERWPAKGRVHREAARDKS